MGCIKCFGISCFCVLAGFFSPTSVYIQAQMILYHYNINTDKQEDTTNPVQNVGCIYGEIIEMSCIKKCHNKWIKGEFESTHHM